jgi:squalene synthase HpnC
MSASFAADLARYGPTADYPPVLLPAARRFCRSFTLRHRENFTVASLLLPRPLLRHFFAVYAWCRWADNLADETGGGAFALPLLRWWRSATLEMYQRPPQHPILLALRETVERFAIPPQPFLDLLFAFEQDQLVKRYQTYEQLLAYCRHSANPVGHLVLYLLDAYDAERAALADFTCTALQLANFWQDVARDYNDLGRVYLPAADRRFFGYTEDDLVQRHFTPQFAELMRYQIERTRDLFYRGLPLVDRVPAAARVEVELFTEGGLAVLRGIERVNYNVWRTRPTVSAWEKGTLLAGAAWKWLAQHWEPTR